MVMLPGGQDAAAAWRWVLFFSGRLYYVLGLVGPGRGCSGQDNRDCQRLCLTTSSLIRKGHDSSFSVTSFSPVKLLIGSGRSDLQLKLDRFKFKSRMNVFVVDISSRD